MFKADVRTAGNMIEGRQGWAYVCNSGNIVVLEADMDQEQKYEDLQIFGPVKVGYTHRGFNGYVEATLKANNSAWYLGSSGAMLAKDFTFYDQLDCIKFANYPKVEEGSIVAVAMYSKKSTIATLALFKAGKVDVGCMTVANLIPLNEEEMKQVENDVIKWAQ